MSTVQGKREERNELFGEQFIVCRILRRVPERLTQKCAKRVSPKNTPMCSVIIVLQNTQKNKALPSSVKKPIHNKQQATYEPPTRQNSLSQILTMPHTFAFPSTPIANCLLFHFLTAHPNTSCNEFVISSKSDTTRVPVYTACGSLVTSFP